MQAKKTMMNLIQIKKTKSVDMSGDKDGIRMIINYPTNEAVYIPAKVVFQVLRGLISYTQHFYRRHETRKI